MKSIISAIPLAAHNLDVVFDDDFRKTIDITPFIRQGVSSALRDEHFFRQVAVVDGFITWPNGFDFCPESLYNYAKNGAIAMVI